MTAKDARGAFTIVEAAYGELRRRREEMAEKRRKSVSSAATLDLIYAILYSMEASGTDTP